MVQDGPVFENFNEAQVDVGAEVRLHVRSGGSGPPVVLLHGHPRTHTTWYQVAPLLVAAGRTVICPDLRGYGRSSTPATTADHSPYSKRAMASDIRVLMGRLGHDRFAVVGHDRGSYVAARLALDAPQVVPTLRCWIVCRSVRPWPAPTPGSPRPGGTGSSSLNPPRLGRARPACRRARGVPGREPQLTRRQAKRATATRRLRPRTRIRVRISLPASSERGPRGRR
jgi:pimeloyl-ACP methyl ester carboxylesterase